MTDTPKLAPATPAATPLREANQQRVDAAAQRVRQAMDYRKYLPGDPFRKDVELLIEIALAPVLEIFAPAQPAATPMAWTPQVEVYRTELMRRFSNKLSMEEIADFSYWAAQPQRESDKCATAPSAINSVVPPATGSTAATTTSPARIWRREPRPGETETPLFNAIWRVVKWWEIEQNGSRWSATGNDVCGIIDSIAEQRESEQPEQALITPKMMSDVFAASVNRTDPDHPHVYDHRIAADVLNKILKKAALSPQTDSLSTQQGGPQHG